MSGLNGKSLLLLLIIIGKLGEKGIKSHMKIILIIQVTEKVDW